MSPSDTLPDAGSSRSGAGLGAAASGVETPAPGRALRLLTALLVIVGVVLRFLPRSDLWLDEALSANIASLPLADIPGALERDGHPPLYYALLHLWGLAGDSDWWYRALSGVVSLVGLPLAYLAGRRLGRRRASRGLGGRRVGLITLGLWAVLPFAVRYASETRMYALVSTLVLAGYLLVDNLLREPARPDQPTGRAWGSAAGLALVTGALLLTHYWALWLGAAVAVLAVVVAVRAVAPDRRRGAWLCLGSLAAGLVLFAPWLPTMLYQSEHTGTPWGEVFRPATIVVVTITDFVGGGFGELQIVSYVLFTAIAVATVGVLRGRAGRQVVELGVTPQARILPELWVLLGTLVIGWAASVVAGSTYASRYAAVVAPLFALCVAGGVAMARTTRTTAVITLVVGAALVAGSAVEVVADRTQAGRVAERIAEDIARDVGRDAAGAGAPPTVIVCPDQLGPATHRALEHRGVEAVVVPFPDAGDPRFVDWVDYAERNADAEPAEFTQELVDEVPAGGSLYAVTNPGYATFEGKCEIVLSTLSGAGGQVEQLDTADPENHFESMDTWVLRPSG